MRKIFAFGYLLLLCSCGVQNSGKSVELNSEKPVIQVHAFPTRFDGEVDLQIHVDADYLKGRSAYLMRFDRKNGYTNLRYLTWDAEGIPEIFDAHLPTGTRYTYFLVADPTDFVLDDKHAADIFIPYDLKIARDAIVHMGDLEKKYPECVENRSGAKVFNFGELQIENGGYLLSDGENWIVRVRELVGTGGTIASFLEKQKAEVSKAGRGSGQIFLDVDYGTGTLNLISRGENGGDGMTGAVGKNGRPGAPGSDELWLEGGNRGHIIPATYGPVGSVGGAGGEGGRGGNGGDALSFGIRARKNHANLNLQFQADEGVGGAGGKGGRGGLGGARTAGSQTARGLYPVDGPMRAADGPAGKEGAAGNNGRRLGQLCWANEAGRVRPSCWGNAFLLD